MIDFKKPDKSITRELRKSPDCEHLINLHFPYVPCFFKTAHVLLLHQGEVFIEVFSNIL